MPSVDGRGSTTGPPTVGPPLTARTLPDLMPLSATLGIRFGQLGPDRVAGEVDWHPRLCTAGGVMHGGTLVALADSVAGVCAYLNLPTGAVTSTIELTVNFLAAVRRGTVQAVARPLSVGRSVIVVQTDLHLMEPACANGTHGGERTGERPAVGIVVQSQIVLR
ncbi:PaaI family thioesterase [Solwaraspora sp. WMMB335]|uniref:PaaI family thioesterase n=1 Tax=Solwaraspora sp. WMMB335 TaxID=3404118 RepID=UPI003B950044